MITITYLDCDYTGAHEHTTSNVVKMPVERGKYIDMNFPHCKECENSCCKEQKHHCNTFRIEDIVCTEEI